MADKLMADSDSYDQGGAILVSLDGIFYSLPIITSPESASDYQLGGTVAYGFVA